MLELSNCRKSIGEYSGNSWSWAVWMTTLSKVLYWTDMAYCQLHHDHSLPFCMAKCTLLRSSHLLSAVFWHEDFWMQSGMQPMHDPIAMSHLDRILNISCLTSWLTLEPSRLQAIFRSLRPADTPIALKRWDSEMKSCIPSKGMSHDILV